MNWTTDDGTHSATMGKLSLEVLEPSLDALVFRWSVTLNGNVLRSGTAFSLDAAQRAATQYAHSNAAQSQASE